jgi:hypothetical protein
MKHTNLFSGQITEFFYVELGELIQCILAFIDILSSYFPTIFSHLSSWIHKRGRYSVTITTIISKPRNHCCCDDGKSTSLIYCNTQQGAHHEDSPSSWIQFLVSLLFHHKVTAHSLHSLRPSVFCLSLNWTALRTYLLLYLADSLTGSHLTVCFSLHRTNFSSPLLS